MKIRIWIVFPLALCVMIVVSLLFFLFVHKADGQRRAHAASPTITVVPAQATDNKGSAQCPSGYVAISGGYTTTDGSGYPVKEDAPIPADGSAPTGWAVELVPLAGGPLANYAQFQVYAICQLITNE